MPEREAELSVRIDARRRARGDAEEVDRALDRVRRSTDDLDRSQDKAAASSKKMSRGLGGVKSALVAVGTAAAALGIAKLAGSFLDAAKTSENFQVRLKVLLGSVGEANRLFDEMSDFASKVPFEFEKIMESSTRLATVSKGGVDEITSLMPVIADLAAAFGLDIEVATDQVARAFAAGAGAADIFREKGVNAMLGFESGAKATGAEFRKTLISAWEDTSSSFRGATADMSNTWTGAMSMISDAWFQFRMKVMDQGLFDALKDIANRLLEVAKSDSIQVFAEDVGTALGAVVESIIWVVENYQGMKVAMIQLSADITRAVGNMAADVVEIFARLIFQITGGIMSLPNLFGRLNPLIASGAAAVVVLMDASNDLRDASNFAADAFEAEAQELLKLSTAADKASESTETLTGKTTAAGGAVKEITDEVKKLAMELGKLQAVGREPLIFGPEIDSAIGDIKKIEIAYDTTIDKIGDGSTRMADEWRTATEQMTVAFAAFAAQVIRGTQDMNDSYRELWTQLQTIAGYAVGTMVTGSPQGGQVGAMIGAFTGDLIGGMLFGDSAPAWGPADVGALGDRITALTSTGRRLASAIQGTLDQLLGAMGAGLENLAQFRINIRGEGDEFAVTVGNLTRNFSDAADAINFAVMQLIRRSDIVGVSAEVADAFRQAARNFSDIDEFAAEVGRITALAALDLNQLTGAALELSQASQELSRHLATAAEYGMSAAGAIAQFADSVTAIGEGIMARAQALAGQGLDPEQRLRREFEQLREQARAYNAQLRVEIAARQAEVVAIDAQIAGLQAAAAAADAWQQIGFGVLDRMREAGLALGMDFGGMANFAPVDFDAQLAALQAARDALAEVIAFLEAAGIDMEELTALQRRAIRNLRDIGERLPPIIDPLLELIARAATLGERVGGFVGWDEGELTSGMAELQAQADALLAELGQMLEDFPAMASEIWRMYSDILDALEAHQTAILQGGADQLLIDALSFLNRTEEVERLRFTLAQVELQMRYAELQILSEQYGIQIQGMDALGALIAEIAELTYNQWLVLQGRDPKPRGEGQGRRPRTGGDSLPPLSPGSGINLIDRRRGSEARAAERVALFIAAAGDFLAGLRDVGAESGPAGELARINSEFDDLRERAFELRHGFRLMGMSMGEVYEEIESLRQERVAEFFRDLFAPIREARDQLILGPLSTTGVRDQALFAEKRLFDAAEAVFAGDLSRVGDIPGLANEFLSLFRQVFPAGSAQYEDALQRVQDLYDNLIELGLLGESGQWESDQAAQRQQELLDETRQMRLENTDLLQQVAENVETTNVLLGQIRQEGLGSLAGVG